MADQPVPKDVSLLAADVELIRQKIGRASAALHEAADAAQAAIARKAEIGVAADGVSIPDVASTRAAAVTVEGLLA